MQRSRQLINAIIGSVGGRAATLLAPLLVMPAMLDHIGPRDFGVWMTAIAVMNIAQFADLGIGNGLLTRLSAAFAHEDNDAVRADIASGYAVLSAVAVPLVIAGPALMTALGPAVSPIYGAALAAFAVSIPATVIHRVLYASQQVVRANIWQIVAAILSVGVAFAAIAADWSAAAIVLAYALVSPAMMVVAALFTFAQRPDIAPRIRDVSGNAVRALMGLGSRFLLLAILTATAMSADNILIAAQLGEAAVTDYAVPARIGSLLTLVVGTIMMPLWSAYGEAMARGQQDWVWRNARRMALIGFAAVALVGSMLTLFIHPILMLWMGRSFADAEWIIGGLAVFAALTALTAPFNMILNAAGRIPPQIGAWTVFLALALVAKWLLLPMTGIWVLPFIDTMLYALAISPAMVIIGRRIAGANPIVNAT
jgi:O-antigen/teichoic acid export membrane protein